jgi:AraC family transcriptional regulator of adaptative response / DNA-3-methyladenine glycosylase II
MQLDDDTCYRAVQSRDARFDGRFFSAVKTTGIYCRPICPARTPLRRNITFYPHAAAAEAAGYRPCRRCRPESAPGTPVWQGTSATVTRALRLIEQGWLDRESLPKLCARLGVGERHLNRLFAEHLGTSPGAVARSQRAHLARLLVSTTQLPMSEVAHQAGFRSLRQFNAVVRQVFHATPGELRRVSGSKSASGERSGNVELKLAYRPPLAWTPLLTHLSKRAIRGLEFVDLEAGVYRRVVAPAGRAAVLEVSLDREPGHSALRVRVECGAAGTLGALVRQVRALFDLDADPLTIAAALARCSLLAEKVEQAPGLRVVGAWEPFEALVRAVLGQQVSVRAAATLGGRLVERFGEALVGGPRLGLSHAFPSADVLAEADLSEIGLPAARAGAVRAVAQAAVRDPLWLEPATNLEVLVQRLCSLPGIGSWTAQTVAMRAFREPDAFPAGDLVLRRAASGGGPLLKTTHLEALSQRWRPWRAYAAAHLWHSPEWTQSITTENENVLSA